MHQCCCGNLHDKVTPFCHTHTHTTGDSAADYNIENEDMFLIWAFGQVSPEYNHFSLSEAEFTTAQNQLFFPVDELKYHGRVNRGKTTINFFEAGMNIFDRKAKLLMSMHNTKSLTL